jgi:hypothetical protein
MDTGKKKMIPITFWKNCKTSLYTIFGDLLFSQFSGVTIRFETFGPLLYVEKIWKPLSGLLYQKSW